MVQHLAWIFESCSCSRHFDIIPIKYFKKNCFSIFTEKEEMYETLSDYGKYYILLNIN